MMSDESRFALYGTRVLEAPGQDLCAGPLDVSLQNGNLRTIRFRGHEVLRGIAFLVRDRDWGTCPPEINGLVLHADDLRFAVTYQARFRAQDGAVLTCEAAIDGHASGTLTFSAALSADRDFETARAGFTVLHPLSGLVGKPVSVEHGDGAIERSAWPDRIEPWQPFMDIRAITHGVSAGVMAETRFSGDIFEMEDQRNWTDGSFKTYVRPLALPWPYRVPAGETLRQSVTLSIRETASASPSTSGGGPVTMIPRETRLPLPVIGIGLRPECAAEDRRHTDLPARLGAGHLIGHFDPLAGHGLDALKGYAAITQSSGLPFTLELALPCHNDPAQELTEIAQMVQEAGLSLHSLFVSPSVDRQSTPPGSVWPDCPPLETVYAAAHAAFPHVRLGGGMMSYFTELNRKRVPAARLDFVSHCTNPIVHAADDLSVMQSFEALRDVVRSVRALYPETAYRIGPSTIAMRQNPYGSATKCNPGMTRMPMADVDPRHNARFGAAWTLAYAATVAEAGLDVLTLSTLSGPFGLVAGPDEPFPEGRLRPLASILSALAALAGEPLTALASSDPSRTLGLSVGRTWLIANLTARAVTLDTARDIRTATDIVTGEPLGFSGPSLVLPPYGTVRIEHSIA